MPVLYRTIPEGLISYGWFGGMHSRFDIALLSDTTRKAQVSLIVERCETLVRNIEAMASRFLPDSALVSHYNSGSAMPPELIEIIDRCNDIASCTAGYFDTTVHGEIPDLCGFLKGYAAERIKELLLSEGYSDALINAGNSSIVAIGSAPDSDDWSIGTPSGNIALRNEALSISGLHPDGSAHIVNPLTGQYSTGTPLVVSGPEADVAEVLSTALFAAPPPERPAILANFPGYTML